MKSVVFALPALIIVSGVKMLPRKLEMALVMTGMVALGQGYCRLRTSNFPTAVQGPPYCSRPPPRASIDVLFPAWGGKYLMRISGMPVLRRTLIQAAFRLVFPVGPPVPGGGSPQPLLLLREQRRLEASRHLLRSQAGERLS